VCAHGSEIARVISVVRGMGETITTPSLAHAHDLICRRPVQGDAEASTAATAESTSAVLAAEADAVATAALVVEAAPVVEAAAAIQAAEEHSR
jgi:hypothetical protein